MTTTKKGKLFLIPVPIADGQNDSIPIATVEVIHRLDYFIAEQARTARRFISSTKPPYALPDVEVVQMEKHDVNDIAGMLAPLATGRDIGLMSEAGCPGIADPGTEFVRWAHDHGFEVVPLSGPSSLVMALMSAGLGGQRFAFNGYLPRKKPELVRELKELERLSRSRDMVQLFIETPYRNRQMIEVAVATLADQTYFAVAADISGARQWIYSARVAQWKKSDLPDLHKRPAVFMIMSE